MLNVGDLVSVPFNIACGRCRNCREGKTGICLTVNPARPGAAYGYVDMGGWVGGQAEYVMVPYADFNLIKFPNKEKAMAKIKDLTLLSDIFPTGYHGCGHGRRWTGHHGLYRGRGSGGSGVRRVVPVAGRGRGHRRRHDSGAAGAGQELRLRSHRSPQGRHAGPADRADPRRAGGGLPRWIASASRRTATGKDAGVERPATVLNSLQEVCPRGRFHRYSRPVRHRRSGRHRRRTRRSARSASASAWAGRSPAPSTPASARCCATTASS